MTSRVLCLILLPCLLVGNVIAKYIGCFSHGVLEGRSPSDITASGVECQTTCGQQNHLYSYQFTEHYGTPSYKLWCLCVDDAPNPEDLIDGCHDPTAETTDVTVIIPYQLAYQFVWYNCHTFTPTAPGTLVNSARDCFATCNPYSWAGVVYDQRNPNVITCRCYAYDDHPWYGTPATACLPGAWFIYNHFPQPSGAVRRRYNGFQEGNKKTEVCPNGLTACNLLDSEGLAFECIDTSQELESCGGCRYGIFMSREKEEGPFEDCTVITGAKLGAVTCQSGRCVVSECEDGYTLQDNKCLVK